MTNLEQLLKSLEDARLNATQGELKAYDWTSFPYVEDEGCVRIETEDHVIAFCFTGKPNRDALAIVSAANHILQLIEIIRVQKEVLDKSQSFNRYMLKHFISISPDWKNTKYAAEHFKRVDEIDDCNVRVEAIAKKGRE